MGGATRHAYGRRRRVAHTERPRRPVPLWARRTPDGVRRLEGLALRQRRIESPRSRRRCRLLRFPTASRAGPPPSARLRRQEEGVRRGLSEVPHAPVPRPVVHGRCELQLSGQRACRQRTAGLTGRATICVEAMEPATRERLVAYLADTWGIRAKLVASGATEKAVLVFNNAETAKLHALIAPFVHPSMEYKLLPAYPGSVRRRAAASRQCATSWWRCQ